jgi:small-conductance mechanosensitive channel
MNPLHSIDDFCNWLKVTPVSVTLQTVGWIVPALQTVHILAISALMGSALMIALRMLELAGRDQPRSEVVLRFLRVIWAALPILLVTGLLLITAEPARSLENPAFLLKMTLLVVAIALSLVWRATRTSAFWQGSPWGHRSTKAFAVFFLFLWVGVLFAGRWIAYVQT